MKITEKFIRKALTTFYNILNLYPTSTPYLSGDTFRNLADYDFTPNRKNNKSRIANLENGSIVFVNTKDYMSFIQLRTKISIHHLKIICHNSDVEFNSDLLNQSPIGDIIYAVNATMFSKRLIPIPIGLENLRLYNNGIISRYRKLSQNIPSIPKIFYSFSLHTNATTRTFYSNKLKKYDYAIGYKRLDNNSYLMEMSKFMFCFSPPGNGIDCHRTWESIAINVIPICLKSPLIEYFVSLGLPIWMIEDFSEIIDIQLHSSLENKYIEIMSNSNKESSYIDYWKMRITTNLH
jgi:hypothetical protein